MDKVVAVNTDVPHYLPKFENPIYVAVQEQKKVLRCLAVERIKSGNFENGLAPLLSAAKPISSEELNSIMNVWYNQGLYDFAYRYYFSLATGNIEEAKRIDYFFSEKQTEEITINR